MTLLLTLFSLGIGVGSFGCNSLLKGQIKTTFVPWAMAGISLFTFDTYLASTIPAMGNTEALVGAVAFMGQLANWRIMGDLFGVAVCGGLFVVPLYALLQHESDVATRARTIASNNVINALFMVLSSVITMLMLSVSFTVPEIFLTLATLNAIAALYFCRKCH